jgi:hypothetical protein
VPDERVLGDDAVNVASGHVGPNLKDAPRKRSASVATLVLNYGYEDAQLFLSPRIQF